MAENETPATEGKKRRTGVNKVDVQIKTPADAGPFLEAFKAKVAGEETATKTYNNSGFSSLAYQDIDAEGLLNLIACASDALASKDTDLHQVASQIVANTSRRQIETRVTADYTTIAKRAKFADLDAFARKQTNGATNKMFKNFAELIAVAVDAEMSGDVVHEPAADAAAA